MPRTIQYPVQRADLELAQAYSRDPLLHQRFAFTPFDTVFMRTTAQARQLHATVVAVLTGTASAVRTMRRLLNGWLEYEQAVWKDVERYAAPPECAAVAMYGTERRMVQAAAQLGLDYQTFDREMQRCMALEAAHTDEPPEAYHEAAYIGALLLQAEETRRRQEERRGYGHQQSDGTWLAYGAEPEGV